MLGNQHMQSNFVVPYDYISWIMHEKWMEMMIGNFLLKVKLGQMLKKLTKSQLW